MTLIRELIELPERVHKGDFVLKLSEGVARPEETLGHYVVTPQLAECFDRALGLIADAVRDRSSKATYLHGSFGSGKSHFMAVLHLILEGNAEARSIPDLAAVISKYNVLTEGRKFLLVPYHMIGSRDMESAILGGYADHIHHVRPEAPVPGVYLADDIFRNAQQMRADMGDERFFARLNECRNGGNGGGGGWGALESGWDAVSFEAAIQAPPKTESRSQLVGDLVATLLPALRKTAKAQEEAFVPLDEGLAIISRHAKGLGYDAVILFLDELVLWLASRAADVGFVHREGQKLAKLVEAQAADRPIPIISFVARQRDLRELVGDNITGAEQLSFSDALKHWEGRFNMITLEDRNLAAIAERRVLKPTSEAARQAFDNAFKETEKIRREVMDILLTSGGDRQMFRRVYPFSPALVETLVAVSSVLQRERTALKIMLQLLVDQRDSLQLGDLVPVGDLFDAIEHGDEAFSDSMQRHFDNARKLYHQKLLPILEQRHGIRLQEVKQLPRGDRRAEPFRNDDRLVKTLLLSALVPEVESLKGLTVNRLAALNHGTIRSPIPGREGQIVLTKCRDWAAQVGEIRIGEEAANQTITVQLTGVDTESILEKARSVDNQGNRRRLIKQMLFDELGVPDADQLFVSHEFTWNGTRRCCDILYQNVRELVDETFRSPGDDWRVILDFPFDAEGRTPNDDLARVGEFKEAHPEGARTLVWIPSFFSVQAQQDLGTLVVLEHILAGERFEDYASHLPPVERASARSLLDNQRSQLRQKMVNYLEGAYGVATPIPGSVDSSHDLAEHFVSLDQAFDPKPPVGANLREAFVHLLGQALEFQYPGHPRFDADLRPATLRKVYAEVQRATQVADGRIDVEKPLRTLVRQIANPLKLGEMTEMAFILGHHWKTHFTKKIADSPGGPVTVARLRQWIDEPRKMGLPKEVQNLVIMVWADQTSRSFLQHGGPYEARLEQLADDVELREQRLPAQEDWETAARRAGAVLGVAVSPLLNATNVARLVDQVGTAVATARPACENLCRRLRSVLPDFGLDANASPRIQTAVAVQAFVESVSSAGPDDVVATIARARIPTTEAAMGTSLKKAGEIASRLEAGPWKLLEAIKKLKDHRKPAAEAILREVANALEKDEYAVALGPILRSAQDRATDLLAEAPPAPPKGPPAPPSGPPPVSPPVSPPPPPGVRVVQQGERSGIAAAAGRDVLREIDRQLAADGNLTVDVTWKLYKKG